MIKVVMIGAGSVVFCKNLTGDILSYPEFKNATLAYVDIDPARLEVGAALCRKAARALGANPVIEATLDRRQALRGADFVINMVQVGGFDSTLIDFEIPRQYGLKFTIADTTGPGGIFRALRTYPMLVELCRDMREVCPRALLLNYSNPMGMNMQTIARAGGQPAIGLCHSVQGTFNQLMGYLGEDPASVTFTCAGINHMAFYLRIEKDGVDLYPRLFEAMKQPAIYDTNRVRFEIMRRLGHFVTESSEHNAEYSSWFIPHGREVIQRFHVPIDEYLRRCECIVEQFEELRKLCACDEPIEVHRSHEYGSTIIHSMATGNVSTVYGNMPNGGTIANLPADAIAEAPTVVDRSGPRFASVGELPPQLVAYMSPHVAQQELFIRAAMEGRRDQIYQACQIDPLTAAMLPPDRIVEMCDELIAAHGFKSDGGLLPALECKKTLVTLSGKPLVTRPLEHWRAVWEKRRKGCDAGFIRNWKVIGPFAGESPGTVCLDTATSVENSLADLRVETSVHDLHTRGQPPLTWKDVAADGKGYVDLSAHLGPAEWVFAYAYAQYRSETSETVVLRCGSDDAVKIWVNGAVVHRFDAGRAYKAGDDEVDIPLAQGVNHILTKVTNHQGAWGFGLAISPVETGSDWASYSPSVPGLHTGCTDE